MKRVNKAEGAIEIVGPQGDVLDRMPIPSFSAEPSSRGPAFPDRRRPMVSRAMRRRLEIEQDGTCFLCLKPWDSPTVDHVMPRKLFYGARNAFRNLVIACGACNGAKGGRPPTDAEIERLLALKRPYADCDYDLLSVEPAPRSEWADTPATAAKA